MRRAAGVLGRLPAQGETPCDLRADGCGGRPQDATARERGEETQRLTPPHYLGRHLLFGFVHFAL